MLRFNKTRLAATAVSGLGLFTLSMGAVKANPINVNLASITAQADGTFLWNYRLELADTEQFMAGDFFVVYDFLGYVPGSITAPGLGTQWTATTANSGPTVPNVTIPDNPGVTNLVFGKIGTPTPAAGGFELAGFSARSSAGTPTVGVFGANGTDVEVPGGRLNARGNTQVPIPEPGTMTLLGMGALGVLGYGGLRRKRTS
jgi:hypothetical protein